MRPSVVLPVALAVAAVVAGGVPEDARGAAGSDIGGVWTFRIEGGRGTLALNLGVPAGGVFTARGLGYSNVHRAYFAVDDDAPVTLAFGSNGSVTGTLPLEDETLATDVGTLEVTSGRLGPLNKIATFAGKLTLGGKTTRVVLHGLRRPTAVPDRSGGSHDARCLGAARSTKLFVNLAKSDRHTAMGLGATSDNLGHPFYQWDASGPVRLDGAEVPGFTVSGLLVADQKDEVCGRVTTSHLGAGTVVGRFTFGDKSAPGRPVLHAHVRTDDGRRFRIRATL